MQWNSKQSNPVSTERLGASLNLLMISNNLSKVIPWTVYFALNGISFETRIFAF